MVFRCFNYSCKVKFKYIKRKNSIVQFALATKMKNPDSTPYIELLIAHSHLML